jgi:dTDP-4-dehydrorhamnose 3,5-epimerase
MGSLNLNDIIITPLNRNPTEGGDVLHGMKSIDPGYNGFAEAYFSWIDKYCIKAWKKHNKMTMNLIVPVGMVRFVFFHELSNKFSTVDIGDDRYARITVPPGFWFGFKGLTLSKNLVLNISNVLHDPIEADRLDIDIIKYDWD